MEESFGKEYKLCSQKEIEAIFKNGRSLRSYPFSLHYLQTHPIKTDSPSFRIVISAPKKIFRKAHERNRIKRLLRETIRKNKLPLEEFLKEKGIQMALFVIYTSREEMPFTVLERKTNKLVNQLIEALKYEEHH